ncbi:MAG: hypothetical protein DMG76_26570 [Acidobacteria bacterium]|nr:MAG: hypothetical protein DMG76_26570 [Acidobacteriota bacterium]
MPLPHFHAMPLGRAREAFSHPDWIFEIKWDGFRSLVRIDSGVCKLVSRNGNEFKSVLCCFERGYRIRTESTVRRA